MKTVRFLSLFLITSFLFSFSALFVHADYDTPEIGEIEEEYINAYDIQGNFVIVNGQAKMKATFSTLLTLNLYNRI